MRLFELNGGDGLFADVPEDAVHAGHGLNNPVTDAAEHGEGNFRNGGSDGVNGVDSADDDSPAHIAFTLAVHITNAGGLEIRDDAEILPGHFGQGTDFLTDDGIGLPESFEAVPGNGTDAADAQAGAGEGLTVYHAVRQAKCLTDDADLILIKKLDGLDQLELQIIRQAADIVMGLDADALGR